MEYQKHKCCDQNCDCFEISRVMDRIKSVTYYQVYNAAKEAYVFSFSYIRNGSVGKVNRNHKRFINKALPSNIDYSSGNQGIPNPWKTAPPEIKLNIFTKKINRRNVTDKCCLSVRGVNNAPPSVIKREKFNVHKFVQRENQTESIAV